MKETNIQFIRSYQSYGHTWYDIFYKSGRTVTLDDEDIPKTARDFITNATSNYERYNSIYKRVDIYYAP